MVPSRLVRLDKVEHVLRNFHRQFGVRVAFGVKEHTRAHTVFALGACQHIAVDAAGR